MGDEKAVHLDSEGCCRVASRFGFNSFLTPADARKYAKAIKRRGTHIWIIELEDGTFDYTARDPSPNRPRLLGGYVRTVEEFQS